jgi:hypothetical protein
MPDLYTIASARSLEMRMERAGTVEQKADVG